MDRKILAITDGKVDSGGAGSFTGYASLFGVLDSQGDVVLKGAYQDTLPQFLERGFIAWAHDWADPVATIADAHEDDRGLYLLAEFHSDAAAQQARIRTMERLQRGKFMGLSIGYSVADAEFTSESIRLLKKIDLYETSLVTVPALHDAGVTAAKGYAADPDNPDWLAKLTAWLAEVKEGRAISAARRDRLAQLRDQLQAGATDLDGLLTETAPKDAGKTGRQLYGAFLAEQARLLGVGV